MTPMLAANFRIAGETSWRLQVSLDDVSALVTASAPGESPYFGRLLEFACYSSRSTDSPYSILVSGTSGEQVHLRMTQVVAEELFGPPYGSPSLRSWIDRTRFLSMGDGPESGSNGEPHGTT